MMTNIVDKIADRIRWKYLTAFLFLLLSYILTFYTTQQLLKQANWLNHTNDVIINLNVLESTVKDGESAYRGFIINRDESFLSKFYKSLPVVDSVSNTIQQLISQKPIQVQRLDTIKKLIKEKYTLTSEGIAIYQSNKYQVTDSLQRSVYKGKQLMDEISSTVSQMQNEEDILMSNRSGRLSIFSNLMKIINIGSLIVAILLTLYSIVTYTKENEAKKLADKNAKAFREQLEMRISELADVNKELVDLRSMEKFVVTGRISRTIAHEIRNPLTNINLATEHIRSEIPPNEETDFLLDMITRNGNRINQLISDLLNTTKVTQLDFTKVPINLLLDQSLEFAEDRLELKGIKVVKDYATDLCDISADIEKLKIAFLNIIVNAIEAMDPFKGVLQIKTENKDGQCIATITDNGKGMNKEELSRLFEPYFTTKENGTGLGLANAQNIIISHKATLHADSEPGKGSSFTISLNYA